MQGITTRMVSVLPKLLMNIVFAVLTAQFWNSGVKITLRLSATPWLMHREKDS